MQYCWLLKNKTNATEAHDYQHYHDKKYKQVIVKVREIII